MWQRRAIDREARLRGWDVVYAIDEGYSAKTLRRPALSSLLEEIRAGDVLVVAKLDRLSRSLMDFAGLMERARAAQWSIIALDLGVDMTTPSGEMMANVMASFAQYERRLIGERTKVALAARKAQGVQLGAPRRIPVAVRDRVQAERRAGRSLRAIAASLQEDGVSTATPGASWHASTVRSLLE